MGEDYLEIMVGQARLPIEDLRAEAIVQVMRSCPFAVLFE